MKIATYTIARNAHALVSQWIESTAAADIRVVLDVGSTDGTADLLRQQGVIVEPAAIEPWRFDAARNSALNLVPADVDVCIKLDLGERLAPGWRPILEKAWQPGTTRLRYWYTANDKGGVPELPCRAELIHARHGYRWRHAAGEILTADGPETIAVCGLAVHQAEGTTPPVDLLPLLELAVREDRCPHTLFSLGREHFRLGQARQASELLPEYLSLAVDAGRAERSEAMRMLGVCRKQMGKFRLAKRGCVRGSDGSATNHRDSL